MCIKSVWCFFLMQGKMFYIFSSYFIMCAPIPVGNKIFCVPLILSIKGKILQIPAFFEFKILIKWGLLYPQTSLNNRFLNRQFLSKFNIKIFFWSFGNFFDFLSDKNSYFYANFHFEFIGSWYNFEDSIKK